MKRILTILICLTLLVLTYLNITTITNRLADYFKSTPTVISQPKNQYAKNKDYMYVQLTEDYKPYNYH